MFVVRRVRARGRRPGVLARRARAAGDDAASRRRSRSSRSCAATAGATAATSCTSASPCCSSASPPPRRSRTCATCACAPGQTARVGGYDITYVKPTGASWPPATETERIDLGAVLRVAQGRQARRRRCAPTRGYFPTQDPRLGPVGRFFEGEATSEVGLRAGWRRDLWTVITARPLAAEADASTEGNKALRARRAATACTAAQRSLALATALRGLSDALRRRAAAGHVPHARLAAGDLDLDRRADRVRRRPDLPLAGAAERRARPRARGLQGARGARARRGPDRSRRAGVAARARVVLAVVVLVVSAPLRAPASASRRARGRAQARGARGRARGQVPRDPRRRARPPHRQALRGRLAGAGPRAARRGRRDPPAPATSCG